MLIKFWDEDSSLLKVWLSLDFAARIKLRRPSAVTITTPDLGLLASDVALLCHKMSFESGHTNILVLFCNSI